MWPWFTSVRRSIGCRRVSRRIPLKRVCEMTPRPQSAHNAEPIRLRETRNTRSLDLSIVDDERVLFIVLLVRALLFIRLSLLVLLRSGAIGGSYVLATTPTRTISNYTTTAKSLRQPSAGLSGYIPTKGPLQHDRLLSCSIKGARRSTNHFDDDRGTIARIDNTRSSPPQSLFHDRSLCFLHDSIPR